MLRHPRDRTGDDGRNADDSRCLHRSHPPSLQVFASLPEPGGQSVNLLVGGADGDPHVLALCLVLVLPFKPQLEIGQAVVDGVLERLLHDPHLPFLLLGDLR